MWEHIATHPGGLVSLTVVDEQIVTSGFDKTVRSWSTKGDMLGVLETPKEAWSGVSSLPACVAVSEDVTALAVEDSLLAVGHGDDIVELYSLDAGVENARLWEQCSEKWVYGLGFSPSGDELAV